MCMNDQARVIVDICDPSLLARSHFFNDGVRDHQCGFMGFLRNDVHDIFAKLNDS